MLYLYIDRNLVAPGGLSVTAGSSLTVAQPPRFSATRRSGGHGTVGTTADDHPVTRHARVNSITLVTWNHCFGTMAQYCFRDASLRPNLAAFLYIELPLITNLFKIPWCSIYSGFTAHASTLVPAVVPVSSCLFVCLFHFLSVLALVVQAHNLSGWANLLFPPVRAAVSC